MNDKTVFCLEKISIMIKKSKTKVIFPIITYGLLIEWKNKKKQIFSDREIKECYHFAVNEFKSFLGHDIHIGGKYYDAYPSRNLPKYGVLSVVDNKIYKLQDNFIENSSILIEKIPKMVKEFINNKLGIIPFLSKPEERFELAKTKDSFLDLIKKQIEINPTNFEIFCFAILKIHLEKFACKIYRDTRTSAHDRGVDLSTNFGVIYQIKKLRLLNKNTAENVYNELKTNFSDDRLNDGNVILIIDDISKDVKSFLINMKIQTITKLELIAFSNQLEIEDRMKVLQVVFNEFSREYKSDI